MPNTQDILIIEDDTAIVDFMIEALQEDGYTVRSAYDREQGLSEIEHVPPALILLDLHMPGITTIEFLERVHANGFPLIPIVIMTADMHATTYLSTQLELTYLLKPFDLDALLECVAKFAPPALPRGG
jgi:CheY-like chemotaxis protein